MRASLYARVSSEDQVLGYSLGAQSRAFTNLVEDRGWTTYKEYVEERRSAHTDDVRKRPVFLQAIEDAIARQIRCPRRPQDRPLLSKAQGHPGVLRDAGKGRCRVRLNENQIDYSTPTGKLMLVMQGGLAELYSDNLGQEVKKGLHERKA